MELESFGQAVQSAALLTSPGARSIAGAGSAALVAKAEQLSKGPNPRFISATSLPASAIDARTLYEAVTLRSAARSRIGSRSSSFDLFADRTSAATRRANQLRLWFASFAYVLLEALRRIGLRHTQFAVATCGTIRLKLLRTGAHVR